MANTFEEKRIESVKFFKPRLAQISIDDPACKLYKNYAIVLNNASKIMEHIRSGKHGARFSEANSEPMFVPLPIDKMSTKDWKALFWLNVQKLVINGVELSGGLCGNCDKYMDCVMEGIGQKGTFECKTNYRHLLFLISRRSKTSSSSVTG